MEERKSQKVLSPLNAWSFSFGCLLGWSCFVMPATVFLPLGGVLGSLLAFLVGGLFIAMIALNYHYLASICKGNGGIFYLLHNTMGREHGFAASWAICLAYMVIIPLSAKSLARLVKALLMEYAGVEWQFSLIPGLVPFIDFLLMAAVLLFFCWINIKSIRLTGLLQTVFAVILFAGLVIMCVMTLFSGVYIPGKMQPLLYPGKAFLPSFAAVFIVIPWAFVGFDSVPALSREVNFSKEKLGKVMVLAVAAGAFGYMLCILITVTGSVGTWPEFVNGIPSETGLDTISVIAAMRHLYGNAGLTVAMITLLAAILSGPNSTIAMVSRVVYAMSKSNSLFPFLANKDEEGVSSRAVIFVTIIGIVMTLAVDDFNTLEEVAAVCAAFAYGHLSFSAFLNARKNGQGLYILSGLLGFLVCVLWVVLLLVPTSVTGMHLNTATYAQLAVWLFFGIWAYSNTCRKPYTIFEG